MTTHGGEPMNASSSGYEGEVLQPRYVSDPTEDVVLEKDSGEPQIPRAKRVVPPNALLPRTGRQVWRYRLNKMFGRPDKVPELGLEDEIEFLSAKLVYLARTFIMSERKLMVVFANLKGGASKTTIANLAMAMIREVSRVSVGLMPGTASVGTSTTGSRAGVIGETLSLRQFEAKARRHGSYHKVSGNVPPSLHGVSVVSEDTDQRASAQDDFGLRNFAPIAQAMWNRNHVLGIDTGNDDIRDGNIGLEVMRHADVIVFTATVGAHDTLLKLSQTMAIAATDDEARSRVRRGIAVFSGVSGSKDPEDYEKYTQQLDHKGRVIDTLGFKGKLMTIPRDDYISPRDKGKETRVTVTNLNKIARPTYLAVLRLAVAIYESVVEGSGHKCVFAGYTDDHDSPFSFRIIRANPDSSERK